MAEGGIVGFDMTIKEKRIEKGVNDILVSRFLKSYILIA